MPAPESGRPAPGSSPDQPLTGRAARRLLKAQKVSDAKPASQDVATPTTEHRRLTRSDIALKDNLRKGTQGFVTRAVLLSERATDFVLRTREARLQAEARSRQNAVERGKKKGWKFAQTIAEAVPGPAFYGPGDIITGLEAAFGKDMLGQRLAPHQRVAMGLASLLPVVPGRTILDGIIKVQDRVANEVERRRLQPPPKGNPRRK